MKKIYLIALVVASNLAFAQTAKKTVVPANANVSVPAKIKNSDVEISSVVRINPNTKPYKVSSSLGKGPTFSKVAKIGETKNNQQTNASIYTRIYAFPGGKVSATWTSSQNGPTEGSVSRGSGYNHFDGTSWGSIDQSSLRIEPERTGFPCYAYSALTNEELIISHIVKASGTPNAGAATGLMLNKKSGLGAGVWSSTPILDSSNIKIPGILWNRSVISGNYLHVFASFTDSSAEQPNRVLVNGIRNPQVYSRYNLSNNTWEVKKRILPGYTSDRIYSGGGDNYAIDAKGSNVAIIVGGLSDDLQLYKSSDNGNNWTKTIIDSFPIPAFDFIKTVDTTDTNDGSLSVSIDKNGNAHCFWAFARMIRTEGTANGSFSYFPGQNSILYWRENTPLDSIKVIAGSPDVDKNGELDLGSSWNATGTRYFSNSIATMPHASISGDTIFTIFSGMAEADTDPDGKNYRDVYLTYSTDLGKTWSDPLNLTGFIGFNLEQIYASISPTSDDHIHLTFSQSDGIGAYDATDNPSAGLYTYDIMYLKVPKTSIFDGTVGVANASKNETFAVVSNFPNPFKGTTNIGVNFSKSTNATVKVYSILGNEVYQMNYNKINAGLNNLEIDLSNVKPGVYMYSIEADGFKATGKMIAE